MSTWMRQKAVLVAMLLGGLLLADSPPAVREPLHCTLVKGGVEGHLRVLVEPSQAVPSSAKSSSDIKLKVAGFPEQDWIGKPKSFINTNLPFAAVVILDLDESRSTEVKRGLVKQLEPVREFDQIAILSTAQGHNVLSPFGASKSDRTLALNNAPSTRGPRPLWDSVAQALDVLSQSGTADRKAIFLFSKGLTGVGKVTLPTLIKKASNQEIPIYVALLPDLVTMGKIAGKGLGKQVKAPGEVLGLIHNPYLIGKQQCESLANATIGFAEEVLPLAGVFDASMNKGVGPWLEAPVVEFPLGFLPSDGAVREGIVSLRVGSAEYTGHIKVPALPAPTPQANGKPYLWLAIGGLVLGLGAFLLLVRTRRSSIRPPALDVDFTTYKKAAQATSSPAPTVVSDELGGMGSGTKASLPGSVSANRKASPIPHTQYAYTFQAPSPGHPAAYFRILSGPRRGELVPIEVSPFVIGADASCTLAFPDDAYMSGRHVEIIFDAQTASLQLRNLKATNGTWVDSHQIEAVIPLAPENELKVGHTTLTLLAPDEGRRSR